MVFSSLDMVGEAGGVSPAGVSEAVGWLLRVAAVARLLESTSEGCAASLDCDKRMVIYFHIFRIYIDLWRK
jgi:hypothetical protein